MKNYLLILLCIFCLPVSAQDKKAISAILDRQAASWNTGNLELFMQDYWKSDSLLYVGKSGPKYGWQTALNTYKKNYPDKATMGQLDFQLLKIDFIDKNHAFVLGRWHLKEKKTNRRAILRSSCAAFPKARKSSQTIRANL